MAHLISQGSFLARAINGSYGEDTKGRMAVRVELELLAGPDLGQRITYTGLVNAKSAPYVGKDLKAVGWKGVSLRSIGDDVQSAKAEAQIEIEHKNANDPKDPNRVFAVVRSIGRGAVALKPASAASISDADEALRAAMGGVEEDVIPF